MATFDKESDRHGITQIITGMDKAWMRGDAEAIAARFAEDAGLTNGLGMVHYGRKALKDGGWITSYLNVSLTPLPAGP